MVGDDENDFGSQRSLDRYHQHRFKCYSIADFHSAGMAVLTHFCFQNVFFMCIIELQKKADLIILIFSLMMRMMKMVEEAERHLAQGRRGLKLCI